MDLASKIGYSSNDTGPISLGSGSYPIGGYNYDGQFVQNVQEYCCQVCAKVMRDPMQIPCGHHCCRSCLEVLLRNEAQCLLCSRRIDPKAVHPDAYMRNHISVLEVRCPNARCVWRGSISTIESHVKTCKFNSVKCEYCGELIEVIVLSQHEENCKKQKIRCTQCNELITQLDQHVCSKEYIQCSFRCGAAFTRDEQRNHEDPSKFYCPNMPRSCPYDKCTQRGMLSVLNNHVKTKAIQHAVYHKEQFKSFQEQLTDISNKQKDLKTENRALKKQLMALQQSHYSTKMKLSSFIRRKEPPLPDESWDYFREMVTIPTNSVLIWEISDFKSVFMRANRQTKIYSPPFYTSPVGFKLCCYAQRGDDQIIRVSIQRMVGKFDDILSVFGLENVRISILNMNRPTNLTFDNLLQQPSSEPVIGPFELSTLQSISQFLGESTSAIIEVTVI